MTKTKKVLLLCLLCMICIRPLTALADGNAKEGTCPVVRIEPERLPDFNIPRYGYNLLCLNGEPVVVGGHTSGFVLTATAEYLKDGKWHLLQTVYHHDGGFTVALMSGKALIAGGFKDNLGIGQSFEVEMYDPVAHRFTGFGCLAKKRASAGAVELDSGRVLKYPDQKANAIGIDSGFANDISFFRTFKALTGQTPGDWKKEHLPQTEIEESKIN